MQNNVGQLAGMSGFNPDDQNPTQGKSPWRNKSQSRHLKR